MVQPQYSPQEALERVKLMMKYDTSKTLNENREIIFEQDTTGADVGEIERELNKFNSDEQKIVDIIINNYKDMSSFQNFLNTYKTNTGKDFSIDVARALSPSQDKTEWDNLKKHLATFGITLEPSPFKSGNKPSVLFSGLITKPEESEPSQSPYSKFPCVKKHRKAVKGKDVDGNDIYTINGVVYYGNGRKRLTNGTMSNYTCNDPEFKGKSKPVEIPEVLKDAEGVMKFQDWLDTNAAGWATGYKDGIIKKGENGGGYGKFGPRTQKAWNNPTYKDGYLKSLQTPTESTPTEDPNVEDVEPKDPNEQ